MEQRAGTIGQSIVIDGELTAKEDLTIEGQVEGKIELVHNVLSIGATARLTGQVLARTVIVMGTVTGNIAATETIDVRETATVEGDLVAPKIGIAEGAFVRGQIDMRSSRAPTLAAAKRRDGKEHKRPLQPAGA